MPLPADVQICSVDDHVVEHRRCLQGTPPGQVRRPRPEDRRGHGRDRRPARQRPHRHPAGVGDRRHPVPHHRAERRRRQAQGGDRPRAGALRRDARRLLRHRRAHQGHGSGRRPRPALLPVASPGFAGSHVLRHGRQGARARRASRRGTTSPSTSGAPSYPGRQIPLAILPYWDADLSTAEVAAGRGEGRQGGVVHREPARRRACRRCTATTGTTSSPSAQDADMPLCLHFGSGGAPNVAPDAQLRRRDRPVRARTLSSR